MTSDSDNDEIISEDDFDDHQTVGTRGADHGFGLHGSGA